ncbi:hypothetical protein ACHAW6_003704 [Cyclotella cf. meneghiniana]
MLIKVSSSNLFETMDNKRKHCSAEDYAPTNKSQRVLTLRELIPPKQFRTMTNTTARSQRLADLRPDAAIPTIVNDDDDDNDDNPSTISKNNKKRNQSAKLDWTAVITRVRSHPSEAAESYFVRSTASSPAEPVEILEPSSPSPSHQDNTILTFKPLHAMLKYDPPLAAVEAVLKAHPHAALDMTFEGTALKIAAESRVSSSAILRLLLVAEMAMRKKVMMEERMRAEEGRRADEEDNNKKKTTGDSPSGGERASEAAADDDHRNFDLVSVIPGPSSPSRMFVGHNPIRWIAESHIPRKTAALLLKWYPVGAFQRPRDDDGLPVEEIEQDYHDEDAMFADSPLIEIIDDFASDQDVLLQQQRKNHEVEEEESESEEDRHEDADDDDDSSDHGHSLLPRRRRTFAEREYWRKERRWEKFLHILYATDKILMSMKPSPESDSTDPSGGSSNVSSSPTVATVTADASTTAPSSTGSPAATAPPPAARFHPVHAFIRCMTNPNLGLEICRPYGVWSILRAMGQRIPSEFTAKDESDGDRTAFQTLAESPATDCKLCIEEIRDVVECLMDADYRSAHLPRKSDGRLIVHVALENGWPCRDMLSRKTSATCA